MANVIQLWKGAVEPAESGASGNEIQAWKGAVEPAAAIVVPSTPSSRGGFIPRGRKPKVRFVDQPEPEKEQEIPEQPRMLRMTPEVRRMIDRYKKGKPASTDGLMGKRKGLM